VFALENQLKYNLYNVGAGKDITIRELAETIQKIVGHKGSIEWDASKPDGTPRKLLDISRLNQEGWKAKIKLENGIKETYKWFLKNEKKFKEMKIDNS
jgi:GDP-L-fucose synthase